MSGFDWFIIAALAAGAILIGVGAHLSNRTCKRGGCGHQVAYSGDDKCSVCRLPLE